MFPKQVRDFTMTTSNLTYNFAGASVEEKKNGMSYAHTYVSKTDRPLRSISVVTQRRAHHLYKEMAQ